MKAIGNITASIAAVIVALLSVSASSSFEVHPNLPRAVVRASSVGHEASTWGQIAIAAIAAGSFAFSAARDGESSEC